MNDVIKWGVNNGVAVVLLGYFILNNNKSLQALKDAIVELTQSNIQIKELLNTLCKK